MAQKLPRRTSPANRWQRVKLTVGGRGLARTPAAPTSHLLAQGRRRRLESCEPYTDQRTSHAFTCPPVLCAMCCRDTSPSSPMTYAICNALSVPFAHATRNGAHPCLVFWRTITFARTPRAERMANVHLTREANMLFYRVRSWYIQRKLLIFLGLSV